MNIEHEFPAHGDGVPPPNNPASAPLRVAAATVMAPEVEAAPGVRAEAQDDPAAPLVSVIIPCYNQANYLGEAIESALNQTYQRVEVVVVDDGSSDLTSEVAARYPRVRCIRQENRGLAAARNTGIRESQGSLLVFLDADDRLLPAALEIGFSCFRAHPECAFVSGAYRYITSDGSPIGTPVVKRVDKDHYLAMLRQSYISMHATVMCRRDILESVGSYDVSLRACEDYDLYLRIARKFPVHCHDQVIAEYRRHDANMSDNIGLMLRTSLTVLRSQKKHVKADKKYREAFESGIRFWKDWYGNQLVTQVESRMLAHRGGKQALRGAMVLLRYAPELLLQPRSPRPALALTVLRYAPTLFARYMVKGVRRIGFKTLKTVLPAVVSRHLQVERPGPAYSPPVGHVRFGDLRRVRPISGIFGYDRGLPVDRYYIEGFLTRHAGDIRGRTLEIGDDTYTRRFGGDQITQSDVLHVVEGNPLATFVGDLTTAEHIPSGIFDCVILTQTLHLIYDVRAALATLYRILKPGGVLLATFPGISQIARGSRAEQGEWGGTWYWSFTALSARRLFKEMSPTSAVEVEAHGNILAAVAFLHGLAVKELSQEELDYHDAEYQVLIAVRAVKPEVAG